VCRVQWYTISMLTYTITGDNVSVSDRERGLIERQFKGFDRFVESGATEDVVVTASKTTAKERENSIRVEVRFRIGAGDFFAMAEAGELMSAVDLAKEELMRVVTHSKAKKQTLYHRSARKFKELIKRGRKVKSKK
jgi:ribosomal subunit interface protein